MGARPRGGLWPVRPARRGGVAALATAGAQREPAQRGLAAGALPSCGALRAQDPPPRLHTESRKQCVMMVPFGKKRAWKSTVIHCTLLVQLHRGFCYVVLSPNMDPWGRRDLRQVRRGPSGRRAEPHGAGRARCCDRGPERAKCDGAAGCSAPLRRWALALGTRAPASVRVLRRRGRGPGCRGECSRLQLHSTEEVL